MEKLSKKITNEIRQILEDCQSGKLKHDQSEFHCGTSHCVAGWKELLDYNSKNCAEERTATLDFRKWIRRFSDFSAWGYAQDRWELTDKEADTLFSDCATFPEQFALLEKLEAGERVL